LAQGDASFRAGEVSVARFYYQQAVDGGEAGAAVRMGETFDPGFLMFGRLRRIYADSEAARFWYQRGLALGAADASQRLAYLDMEPAAGRATPAARAKRYRQHREAAIRRYASSPATSFQQLLKRILHPFQ
jgi:TPR repeat protein